MKKVLVAGTFDFFHPGHEYFLEEAKKYGDELIVVIARDSRVAKMKGFLPEHNEKERKAVVEKKGIADRVLLGNESNVFDIIEEIKPDVICLGYDQFMKEKDLELELKKRKIKVEVIRLNSYHPDKYKSSLYRKKSIL